MEKEKCPGQQIYIWQAGDSVSAIAGRLETTEQNIWRMNGMMNLDALMPGDEICVPLPPMACAEGALYTLKEGDTLLSVARRENVSLMALLEQNPYLDPETMAAGQIICLPKKKGGDGSGAPEYLIDVVKYGQTIADILLEYDISLDAFRRANPLLNPSQLLPGQRYLIPPSGMRGLCPHYSYVILEGETVATIAHQFGVTEAELLSANPDLAPGDFSVGRTICLARE